MADRKRDVAGLNLQNTILYNFHGDCHGNGIVYGFNDSMGSKNYF